MVMGPAGESRRERYALGRRAQSLGEAEFDGDEERRSGFLLSFE